jgi:hypothetical protein
MLGRAMHVLRAARAPAATAAVAAAAYYQSPALAEAPAVGLDPSAWKPLTLSKVTKLSENTAIYRFAFADPSAESGMTVASCLLTKAAIGSQKEDGTRANVMRPYTPISRPEVVGYLDLAVKTYPEGKMSKHMANMKVGDKLDFKGPILKKVSNRHSNCGPCHSRSVPLLRPVFESWLAGVQAERVHEDWNGGGRHGHRADAAGGRRDPRQPGGQDGGLARLRTPAALDRSTSGLRFARPSCRSPRGLTQRSNDGAPRCPQANISEADILMKKEIDARAAANPAKFKVFYVVDKSASWLWKVVT